jgi:hypothetical protein
MLRRTANALITARNNATNRMSGSESIIGELMRALDNIEYDNMSNAFEGVLREYGIAERNATHASFNRYDTSQGTQYTITGRSNELEVFLVYSIEPLVDFWKQYLLRESDVYILITPERRNHVRIVLGEDIISSDERILLTKRLEMLQTLNEALAKQFPTPNYDIELRTEFAVEGSAIEYNERNGRAKLVSFIESIRNDPL